MILESVENGPLIWPTIEENGVTRPKKYSEPSATEAIQADCDVKATNIILQGLPPEVYALLRNHRINKELWERIQLLMQGTSLMKLQRECKLYDEFDKFTYKKGETLRDFYLRFSLLLNDMNIYNMKLEQFQVNTKFLNILPPEWSKFVTNVKLVRDLHTTNIDQLHAYLGQHEFHANEVRLMHEHNSDPLSLVATHQMTTWIVMELNTAKVSLMANLSHYGSDALVEKAQQLEPKLYDGNVIKNTSAIVIPDSEETLMLAKESRSKMLLKLQDPIMLEKKVNTTPVDYAVLNQLSQDFETRFVLQTELSAEQAFWSQNSVNSSDPTPSSRPIKVEVPKELPKVSMVNTSLKKLKHYLAGFDVVVKEKTTTTAITKGSWGFEHIKACFRDEIIPFVKALKDLFNTFDQFLIDELSEVQNVFHQMEQAVE
ncbi:hypothetical protein Tco_1055550 [Tanacetum coccineum]|uniref:Integrase, catalytic region, zinc finger, CCHC-type, peptidase aspartic, catalytic n=1 Tax=Tanacetum coccineum TaxID=301880 RepID=A0ABQ5GZZ1_9ASTR